MGFDRQVTGGTSNSFLATLDCIPDQFSLMLLNHLPLRQIAQIDLNEKLQQAKIHLHFCLSKRNLPEPGIILFRVAFRENCSRTLRGVEQRIENSSQP